MPTYFYAPYLPRTAAARLDWLENFILVAPAYAARFGLTTADLADAGTDFNALNYGRTTLLNYTRTFSKAVTTYADELDTDPTPNPVSPPVFNPPAAPPDVESGIFARICDLIDAKILPTANETEKTALRLHPIIITSTVTAQITDWEALANGQISLVFRRGAAKVVFIYSRRGTETGLTLLDKVANTHFLDTRPNLVAGQSESRDFAIQWSLDGTQGDGHMSPVIHVATKA